MRESNKTNQCQKRQIHYRSRQAAFGNDPDEGALYSKKYSGKGQWKAIFTSFCDIRLRKQCRKWTGQNLQPLWRNISNLVFSLVKMNPARQDWDSKIRNKASASEIRLVPAVAGLLAGATLPGTVSPQISSAMELIRLNRDFVSLHSQLPVRNVDLPFDASKICHWPRQGSRAPRPQGWNADPRDATGGWPRFQPWSAPREHFPHNAPCFNKAGWRLSSL